MFQSTCKSRGVIFTPDKDDALFIGKAEVEWDWRKTWSELKANGYIDFTEENVSTHDGGRMVYVHLTLEQKARDWRGPLRLCGYRSVGDREQLQALGSYSPAGRDAPLGEHVDRAARQRAGNFTRCRHVRIHYGIDTDTRPEVSRFRYFRQKRKGGYKTKTIVFK